MAINTQKTNIYIVGAQCTGKTTLVNALRDHFTKTSPQKKDAPGVILEVARSVLRKHQFTSDDVVTPERSLALQGLILKAQAEAERAIHQEEGWFISDRSGMDPIVYAKRYVGQEAFTNLMQTPEWKELKERMSKSLIIVCEPCPAWLKDDGVRLMPKDIEDWTYFHDIFCESLDEMGLQYENLPARMNDTEDRTRFVITKWEEAGNNQR
ncbi:AAA domain-containing protein [Hypoxylon trugodes]|uniref:AAA domain-containing protein n=1 Tax=Hypoxylon trugodes TaxID=326681 RepID=UPI0021A22DC1|nr:AAA domain-containing protein [Hypoxylon trugodes]KAI1386232.1 AAA domain-containing protein [Hypoxylon trugodes]